MFFYFGLLGRRNKGKGERMKERKMEKSLSKEEWKEDRKVRGEGKEGRFREEDV